MSFKKLSCALSEALIEDLHPFTPYSMAFMSDYGKVGGYASAYLEVKRDAEGFLHLCRSLGVLEATHAPVLHELVADRLMREEFFRDEQMALIGALQKMASALRGAPATELEQRARALHRDERTRFDRLMLRSGIDPEMRQRSAAISIRSARRGICPNAPAAFSD